jgi:iron complex outermembrane recepter protein
MPKDFPAAPAAARREPRFRPAVGWLLLALLPMLLAPRPALAQARRGAAPPLKRLSLEELMEIDVTSVSKRSEPLAGAAAAVTVLTRDDIRRSGAATLPEVLRLATGLAVARFDSRTYAISARGFNITTANKLLVLIDGRSIYTPLFSGVFWDAQDVFLGDVERIEVIRGPGRPCGGPTPSTASSTSSPRAPATPRAGSSAEAPAVSSMRWPAPASAASWPAAASTAPT